MKTIIHHRDKEPFEQILKGNKKMEIRLYDKKRRKIKIGQTIRTLERGSDRELLARVIGLSRFPDFKTAFKVFGDKIKPYEKELLKKVYPKSKEEKYGVLIIHFELVN